MDDGKEVGVEVAVTKSENGSVVQEEKRIWAYRNFCLDEGGKFLGEYSSNESALAMARNHVENTGHNVQTRQVLKA